MCTVVSLYDPSSFFVPASEMSAHGTLPEEEFLGWTRGDGGRGNASSGPTVNRLWWATAAASSAWCGVDGTWRRVVTSLMTSGVGCSPPSIAVSTFTRRRALDGEWQHAGSLKPPVISHQYATQQKQRNKSRVGILK